LPARTAEDLSDNILTIGLRSIGNANYDKISISGGSYVNDLEANFDRLAGGAKAGKALYPIDDVEGACASLGIEGVIFPGFPSDHMAGADRSDSNNVKVTLSRGVRSRHAARDLSGTRDGAIRADGDSEDCGNVV
jgi:hypothetical protein